MFTQTQMPLLLPFLRELSGRFPEDRGTTRILTTTYLDTK